MRENNYPLLRHLQTEANKELDKNVRCTCGWQGTIKQLKVNDSIRYCPVCLLPGNLKYRG